MLLRLFLLFSLVPLLELWLLVYVAEVTGIGATILLVVTTGMLGAWLARREGLRVLVRIQEEMSRGGIPTDAMVEGVMILVAGIVLVTPGIMTDVLGFMLLIPWVRRAAARRLKKSLSARVVIVEPSADDVFVDVDGVSVRKVTATQLPGGDDRSGDGSPGASQQEQET